MPGFFFAGGYRARRTWCPLRWLRDPGFIATRMSPAVARCDRPAWTPSTRLAIANRVPGHHRDAFAASTVLVLDRQRASSPPACRDRQAITRADTHRSA
jgi:hypothetical protein